MPLPVARRSLGVPLDTSVIAICADDPAGRFELASHLVSVPSDVNTCPAEPKLPSPSLN